MLNGDFLINGIKYISLGIFILTTVEHIKCSKDWNNVSKKIIILLHVSMFYKSWSFKIMALLVWKNLIVN